MSLQQRLTLFFVLIVILPLAAAGFVVQRVIGEEIGERAIISLRPALDATISLYNSRSEVMLRRTQNAVDDESFPRLLQQGTTRPLEQFLQRQLDQTTDIDFLVVTNRSGALVASASKPSHFVEGFRPRSEE